MLTLYPFKHNSCGGAHILTLVNAYKGKRRIGPVVLLFGVGVGGVYQFFFLSKGRRLTLMERRETENSA